MSVQNGRAFNEWLRTQLKAKKMSQRQLAQQSGVDHSTISRLIKGERTPSLGTATKLARGLREISDESEGPAYFASLNTRTVLPTSRVEYALRGDDLLAEADVLVAPRVTGINTPQKIFPYLHSGRPVLVTDLPTHSQILTPEVACLAPAEPEGFADAIIALARDEPLRRRLGEAGRAFVEANHTFDAHQRRVDRLYDHVRDAVAWAPRQRSACGRGDGFDRDQGDAVPF